MFAVVLEDGQKNGEVTDLETDKIEELFKKLDECTTVNHMPFMVYHWFKREREPRAKKIECLLVINMEKRVQKYCWPQGSTYVPLEAEVLDGPDDVERRYIVEVNNWVTLGEPPSVTWGRVPAERKVYLPTVNMSLDVQEDHLFGRATDGTSKVEHRVWKLNENDREQWLDLTNEEIIVLLTPATIHAVVLHDKEETGRVTAAESTKIKELFEDFDEIYKSVDKPDKKYDGHFVVYHCYAMKLDPDTGAYHLDPRVQIIKALLEKYTSDRIKRYEWEPGCFYVAKPQRVPYGHARHLEANSFGASDLAPTVTEAYPYAALEPE
ncbi:hypothetical protein PISL3812_03903 [Talaromyces islandicus]|uniref:Uncharacterized protein n=1 Tax=Talaromyces islandicus TaxID=28573 RepID=A0A0U1LWE4_TALIS|nr:hypothetical protein PISL3812_03903 [Talaromyces islandicus]